MQSRYFGVLDLFDELELEWRQSPQRELAELRKGDVLRRRRPLREDLARYRAGVALLELADFGSRPGRSDAPLFELLSACLERLCEPDLPPDAALVVFQLGFLQNHGLAPALARCAACDRQAPPLIQDAQRAHFSAGAGGRLCAACAEDSRAAARRVGTMPIAVLNDGESLLAELRAGHLPAPDAVTDAARLLALRDLTERFLDYHLDSTPKASRRFLATPNRNAKH
jgi:DNA repair protein RecO